MKIKLNIFIILFFTAILLLPNMLSAAERKDFLLKESDIIIHFSDINACLEAMEKTPSGVLWNSNEMKPFLNGQSLKSTINKFIIKNLSKNENESNQIFNFLKLLSSELLVGMSFENNPDKTNFYLIANIKAEDEPKFEKQLKGIRTIRNKEKVSKTYQFQGVKIFGFENTKKDDMGWETYFKGHIFFSNNKSWIEKTIVNLKKQNPDNLTGIPFFEISTTEGLMQKIIASVDNKKGNKRNPNDLVFKDFAHKIGLDGLGKSNLRIGFKADKYVVSMNIDNNALNRGIWKIINKKSIPGNFRLAYVPHDISTYYVSRIDFNAFWKELIKVVNSMGPKYEKQFQMVIMQLNGMLRTDFTKNVVGNLGSLIAGFSQVQGADKDEIVIWNLQKAVVMEKVLEKVFAEGAPLRNQMAGIFELKTFKGNKLYCFKKKKTGLLTPNIDSGGIPVYTYISLTVSGGDLVMGDEKLVRSYILKRKGKSFYKTKIYSEIMRKIPNDLISYSYSDVARIIKGMVLNLKKKEVYEPLQQRMSRNLQKDKDNYFYEFVKNLRFDKLPDAGFIADYMGYGVGYWQIKGNKMILNSTIYYPRK